ncbi:hypothetical protein HDU77_009310 [Chytriomyces hyalinus]|nr:hypothetical protein HDU77_009310 [Chytriomyces hyalinus]
MYIPITKTDLSQIITESALHDGLELDANSSEQAQVSGLKPFLKSYEMAKDSIIEAILRKWNQTAQLYSDAVMEDLGDAALLIGVGDEHTQMLASIHKTHLNYLLKELALFEYRAILILRYHASLVARVNQHAKCDRPLPQQASEGGSNADDSRASNRHAPAVTRALEDSFARSQYVSKQERDRLCIITGLNSTQIMIWFTNHRRRVASR